MNNPTISAITPWIHLRTKKLAHPQDVPTSYAYWAAEIQLRQFSELLDFQWGFNVRELRQDSLERNMQFIKCLSSFKVTDESFKRSFCLRIHQKNSILRFFLVCICKEDSYEKAVDLANKSWCEIDSTYPYDYVLHPLNQETFKALLEQEFKEISVVYPSSQTTSQYNTEFNQLNTYSLPSYWSPTETSLELIWRALAKAPEEVIMEVFTQPTLLNPEELNSLKSINEHYKFIRNTQEKNWLLEQSQRIETLHQAFLLQVRLLTKTKKYSYIAKIIGQSLTQKYPLIGGYEILNPQTQNQLINWNAKVKDFEYIEESPQNIFFTRTSFLCNASEINMIFRAPFLTKGGIPGLNLYNHKQRGET